MRKYEIVDAKSCAAQLKNYCFLFEKNNYGNSNIETIFYIIVLRYVL